MNEQKDSASEGVSEAAPDHIWLRQTHEQDGWQFGYYCNKPQDDAFVEYARVHQPPEQNLEDKNSVSPKPTAPSHSSVVIPESVSLDADPPYMPRSRYLDGRMWVRVDVANEAINAERERCAEIADDELNKSAALWRGVANLPVKDTSAMKVYNGRQLAAGDIAAAIRATTQPEDDRQTTTEESPSPASLTESESSSESESTLVTGPDVQAADEFQTAIDEAGKVGQLMNAADASGYRRGLEDAAQKVWNIGHDWAVVGDGAKADAAEYVEKAIRALAASPVQQRPAGYGMNYTRLLAEALGMNADHANLGDILLAVRARLAAPVQVDEVSKEQDNAKS